MKREKLEKVLSENFNEHAFATTRNNVQRLNIIQENIKSYLNTSGTNASLVIGCNNNFYSESMKYFRLKMIRHKKNKFWKENSYISALLEVEKKFKMCQSKQNDGK